MLKFKLIACLILSLTLTACGKDDEPAEGHAAGGAGGAQDTGSGSVARTSAPESGECGKGGSECPAGLECLTWRNGEQACGPIAVKASVLIKDVTLGGSCVFSSPADTFPGATLASVAIIGVDGKPKGHGKLVWEQAGFEVAAERGTPPDGTPFTGDACTTSYNLGCDGQAVFEIMGDGGEVQQLREGETVIVHLRGQESCGEGVADEVEAALCNDPAAAASGKLESCNSKVRMVEARSDLYGPDRVGGTIQYLESGE